MIAVTLFAIGIAALLGVFTQSVTLARRAEMAYTAFNLAKNHVERLKTTDFSSLADAGEASQIRINQDGESDANGTYLRTTTITTSYNSDPLLTRADVSVWYEFRGTQSPSAMEVTTVIYNGG